ncbi:MAG: adenylyl-sulfate reductase subunit alpha [Bacillota bacterium]
MMEKKVLEKDLVIIGGGAAGCFAAIKAHQMNPDLDILLVEKAHIERSGCLAAGINAINAYLTPGETPESFLEYIKKDSRGLVRDDLVYTIGQRVNEVTDTLDSWGLPILKNEDGSYQARSSRSIKIKGEKFKPLLADQVQSRGIEVLNRTVATNYLREKGRVKGCFAFNLREEIFYTIQAGAVICATGGASGIYQPNNTGQARHKMWYSPFNTGAGYAMGIRAGAEMTTFEMRFVALRVKDVLAPTGTFAFAGARQINSQGEEYLDKYEDVYTSLRLFATVQEEKEGRGPCYLDLSHIDERTGERVYKSLLDMCPGLVLMWEEQGVSPGEIKVQIEGTEPYIVGGHCQSGYWIDTRRQTTLPGLYAVGDVAGGAPKKYVTGAFVEAKLAVRDIVQKASPGNQVEVSVLREKIEAEYERVTHPLTVTEGYKPDQLETRLQEIMENYAGGKSQFYELDAERLRKARKLLEELARDTKKLAAENLHQLMLAHEVLDRLDVARVLTEHLLYRQETRWPGYQTRIDYPECKLKWKKFVNSRYNSSEDNIEIIERKYYPLQEYLNYKEGVIDDDN